MNISYYISTKLNIDYLYEDLEYAIYLFGRFIHPDSFARNQIVCINEAPLYMKVQVYYRRI